MRRAAHYLLDAEPKILSDTFARAFAGFSSDQEFLAGLDAVPSANLAWLRTSFALRNRLAEDELADAVKGGVAQYVILGAGLDSFAYRRPDLMQSLTVYEVDHPASQAWKRERVAALGIEVPSTLHYVPIDFEDATLIEGLASAGLDRRAPVFFSWLGVTQYLTREAGLRTLQECATVSSANCTLVMEFIAPPEMLEDGEAALCRSLASASANVGEPWLCFYTFDEMTENLKTAGFGSVELFSPERAHSRYLAGRSDGARLPGYFRMVKAMTPQRLNY